MSQPVLFARQPIFDRQMNTYAYQLICSLDPEDANPSPDHTAEVLVNAFSNFLEKGHIRYLPALIRFDAGWLQHGQLPAVPSDALLLDLHYTDLPDASLQTLRQLAEKNYRLVVPANASETLLELGSVVRIDIRQGSQAELESLCRQLRQQPGKILLADQVDSFSDYEMCNAVGFDLFLGNFFASAEPVAGRKLSRNELVMFQLIGEVNHPDATADSIEQVLQRDPELVASLLRLVNSAAYRGHRTIGNISEAVVLLGLAELRKWVLFFALCHNRQIPSELISLLLLKGKMCELLAANDAQLEPSTAFMTGVLSGIDVILCMRKDELLPQLPLQVEVKRALAGGSNPLGRLLASVEAYVTGQWERLPAGVNEGEMTTAYDQALGWSLELMQELG
ncbi:EAL and HDOD domain-containing protein [Neptuniibacter halophilus]|uniref:EAL and HDOD domain-containing protein n=1 Tax=Neptuniibacter halophilus TaxID=651666 RepID=UPI002574736D|nr:HDOD domain-containing protein [Neptuniibacter halophilus]